MSRILVVVVGVVLIAVAWHDHRTREIPLYVTVPLAVGAWLVRGVVLGWPGLEHALLAWALGVLVFLWPFLREGTGGGDLLLMGALGSVVGGLLPTFYLTLMVLVIGGLIAGGTWLYQRKRGAAIPYGWAFVGGWWGYWLLLWAGGLHV